FSDNERPPFTDRDIRFTTKGDTLYAILFAWPENNEVTVQSLGTNLRLYDREIGSVELVGSKEKIKWSRTSRGLKVKLPEEKPCDHAFVLKVVPKN
ncbi:MAG: alpha-L-fucosidase, partial [Gemmatimonadetes bacterium]|nr:alpha-L-fucosidase [Gemmatimonadota bacterium]